jgi:anti-sigma B factor antagonist
MDSNVILVIDGVVTEIRATGRDQASELSMTAAPFSCDLLDIDDRTVVTIRGEVDLATAPRVLQHLRSALAFPPGGLAVDAGDVTFMDSSGVQMLLTMRKAAVAQDVPFTLLSISEQTRRVLEICNLSEMFGLEPPTNSS